MCKTDATDITYLDFFKASYKCGQNREIYAGSKLMEDVLKSVRRNC